MAAPKKIPPNLEPEIYRLAGEGKPAKDIAAWLKEAHGISVTPRAVQKVIKRIQAVRQQATEIAIKEEVGKSVAVSLSSLYTSLNAADEDVKNIRDAAILLDKGSIEWKRCMEVVSARRADGDRALALHFRLSGVGGGKDEPDGVVILGPEGD